MIFNKSFQSEETSETHTWHKADNLNQISAVNDSGYQILYTIHNRHEKLLLKQIYYSDKS